MVGALAATAEGDEAAESEEGGGGRCGHDVEVELHAGQVAAGLLEPEDVVARAERGVPLRRTALQTGALSAATARRRSPDRSVSEGDLEAVAEQRAGERAALEHGVLHDQPPVGERRIGVQ